MFTRASDMPFSNVSSPRVVWLYADQKPTSNASKITIFRAQIRKNNTSVFVMKQAHHKSLSRLSICNGEFPSEFPLAKHTRKRRIYLTNGFPLPNSKRLSLGRVPSRDKRSRGLRFHRNHLCILLGRDREGLLRLSIVHRLGVLPGTFLKMRSLCFFFVSLRDARLSNVRER